MAMPRPKKLKYRSLHYKELLIFLNIWKDLHQHPMWGTDSGNFRQVLSWLKNFQTFIAAKVIEDTLGYVTITALQKTLGFKTRVTAERRIHSLMKLGLLSYTGKGGQVKHYHITGEDAFTNFYPQNWLSEYQRLMKVGLKLPTIKYIDKQRPKKDGINRKQ